MNKEVVKESKQNAATEIKTAEKMLAAVPDNKRDFITGVLMGMEYAEQKAKTA